VRVGRLAMATAALAAATGAAAHGGARRVLLLVADEHERAAAARVEGQIADLDVSVVTAVAALPTDPGAQLALARARALEQRAEAVVWFVGDGGAWVVRVAQGDRVLSRRVARASGELSDSATLEAVGLAVRTELRGLAAGGRIGDEPARPGPFAPLRPWVELGWSGVLDGGGAPGHHGASGRLGAAAGRWRAAVTLAYYPARTLGSSLATARVERQAAGVVVGVDVLGRPAASTRWRLGLELGAGAARFPRVTTGAAGGLTPTAAGSPWSPVIAPSIRAARRLDSTFWLAFSLGADLLLRPPEFGVATGTGFARVSSLWPVEPRATLSLAIDAF
jgi:hypothetical protein